MTSIKNTTTGEIIELECRVDGVDILADFLGGCGHEADDEGWLLDDDEVAWTARWAAREERITAAYAEANEEERAAYERAVDEYSYDAEAMQDAEEAALGLEPYDG